MKTYQERFFAKISPEPMSGCWLWMGAYDRGGYGRFFLWGENCTAHRVSYEMHKGAIPEGLQIDHLCRVHCCVNPDHLDVVTQQENLRRERVHRPTITHCKYGHEFNDENTRIYTRSDKFRQRMCRTCERLRSIVRRKK